MNWWRAQQRAVPEAALRKGGGGSSVPLLPSGWELPLGNAPLTQQHPTMQSLRILAAFSPCLIAAALLFATTLPVAAKAKPTAVPAPSSRSATKPDPGAITGPATEVVLTADGKARAVIILPAAKYADDLSTQSLLAHVKQMSGVRLPALTEAELGDVRIEKGRLIPTRVQSATDTFILLGESELTRRLGLSLDGVGAGGIVLKSSGNTLAILGRADTAAGKQRPDENIRAVCNFLEVLGCRFLWPGETGKVVPAKPSLAVTVDVRFTPPIGQRGIRFLAKGPRNFDEGLAQLGLTEADYRASMEAARRVESAGGWGVWNGLGGSIGLAGGHAGGGLRGGWDTHGQAHPEWFALQPDGSRDQAAAGGRWRLCVSNPGLVERVASDLLAELQGRPQAALSLSPNDGGYSSFCMCEACKKLDAPNGPKITLKMFRRAGAKTGEELEYVSLTDRYVHYWNAVVERVTKVVPEQLFIVDAYSYYSDPPVREQVHPNLVVRYVPSSVEGWKGWQAAGARRSYWRPNNLHGGYREGMLKPGARAVAEALQGLAQHGMLATDMQGIYDNWATQGLEYYTAARLSWDPSRGFDALLDDYCQTGFGAGAASVKKYFLRSETAREPKVSGGGKGQAPIITPATLAELRALLVAAAKATASDAPAHRRVAFLRAGLEFTAISVEAYRLKDASAEGAVAAKAAATVMERRWQLMRALAQHQPLAVNVPLVAGHDGPLNSALGWRGPTDAGKAAKLQLPTGDDWLYEDQSATRKQ